MAEPPETGTASGTAADAWGKLLADPAHAPEFLALAAVRTLGPRAAEWAAQTRAAYPKATDQALTRLATSQFTRLGSVGGAVGALAGLYTPAALMAGAALTQAGLALHVAAAQGLDPTHPDRAAELLVIAGIHASTADAEAAIRKAGEGDSGPLTRFAGAIARQAAGWGLVKLANRYFPGTAFLTALLTGTSAARQAATRATAYYRRSQESQD
nr:hypothetical protein [uncultured Actinoplanes sp.]